MRSKILVVVSVCLNIALVVVILESLRARHAVNADSRDNQPVRVSMVTTTNNELPLLEITPAPVVEKFDWSQLASVDFKKYRDNLRAIHCPDQTIRDIINSEINEFFALKRRGYLEQLQLHFWEFAAHSRPAVRDVIVVPDLEGNEYSKALGELSQAQQKLVEEVLGDDPSDAEENKMRLRKELGERYAWLPAAKREQMIALEEKYRNERPIDGSTPEAQARGDKLLKDFQDTQKQLLSPEEYEEFHFRDSGSSWWAARLSGLEVNEAEWRELGKLLMHRDEDLKVIDSQSPLRDEISSVVEFEIKGKLGAERYAQYQLSKDNDYQQTLRIIKRYELPDTLASQTHQMQQIAIAGANQIRANPNLSPETKQAALAAIQQETERSLNATLGQKIFGTYQKYNGDWLKQLGQVKLGDTQRGE